MRHYFEFNSHLVKPLRGVLAISELEFIVTAIEERKHISFLQMEPEEGNAFLSEKQMVEKFQ